LSLGSEDLKAALDRLAPIVLPLLETTLLVAQIECT